MALVSLPMLAAPRTAVAQAPRLVGGLVTDLSTCQREARMVAMAPVADASAVLACIDRIRAADLVVGEEHKDLETFLQTDGASADALARHARVVAASRVEFDGIYALADAVTRARDAGDQAAIRSAADALARHLASRVSPADRRPLAQSVAYSQLNLARVPAPTGPAVVPAYLQTEVVPPTSEDLAADSDAMARTPIAAQAVSLGRDPIAIFEFVQNEIETEFYQGVVKGAAETLRQKRGNGSDQAALLVALMRASDVPARFVRGTIMLDAAQAMAWTGVSSARRAADIFTRAGMPFDAITQGGGIGAFRLEHIWAEVFVSYGNYRGVPLDTAGRAWVPLDPSWKPLTYSRGKPVPVDARFTADAVTADYLSAPQQQTIADFYKTRIADALIAQDASARFEEVIGTFARQSIRSGLLPNTLPYAVALVTAEQTTLPSALQHQVRFTASGDGGPSFEITLPASDVVGRRVTLSYVPATVEDQITANAFLGIDNTPAYLLRLRPVLKVGGVVRAAGETTVQMGSLHDVRVEIQSPARTTAVVNSMAAGGYYAIAFGLQEIGYVPADPPLPADTEHGAADLLFRRAADYLDRWSAIERLLGGILGVVPVHPILSMAIVGNEYRRTVLFGQPQSLEWRGVFIDADLRVTEPVPIEGGDLLRSEFMRLSGLAGSALESEILHDAFEVDAVSATRLIQLARSAGTPIERITSANVDAVLETIATADEVKTHIRDAVNQGLEVTIPSTDSARNIWTGIGYIALNPGTGEGGYFISGGLAGGMTTTDPDEWVRQHYAAELGNPNRATPNSDPNAAFSITKLVITDKQDGKVDQRLQRDLAVWVRDAEGLPVAGANVTFKVLVGGGTFGTGQGGTSSEVVAQTNNLGIAKANPKLGKKTGDSPFYVQRQGDQWATQVGNNAIAARVATAGGDITLDVPFQLFAYPGLPDHIIKVNGDNNTAFAGTAAGTLRARLVDEFENPIANALLTFEVILPVPDQSSTPTFRNMTIYKRDPPCPNAHPLLGDCDGVSLLTLKTSVYGAAVDTILGNAQSTRYRVSVAADAIPAKTFEIATFDSRGSSSLTKLNMSLLQLINDRGELLNSAKVGTVFRRPLSTELFVTEQEYEWERLPPVLWPPPDWPIDVPLPPHPPNFRIIGLGTVRTRAIDTGKSGPIEFPQASGIARADKSQESATVDFTVTAGAGSALPAINPGHGIYSSRLTVGAQPGVNKVQVDAAAQVVAPKFDLLQGFVEIETVDLKPGERLDGFREDGSAIISGQPYTMTHEVIGVRATLEPRNLLVGQSGGTVKDFTLDYLIEPPNYHAQVAYVDLLRQPQAASANAQDEWLGFLPGSATDGAGNATVYQGTGFDPTRLYRMQVVLNRGTDAEIKSDAIDLGAYLAAPFGSDFRARRFTAEHARKPKRRDLADELRTERGKIQNILNQGIESATTHCGVPMRAVGVLIVETGTGACLWRDSFDASPVGACSALNPGNSNHAFEVLLPASAASSAACVLNEMASAGRVEDFGEITFGYLPRPELENARLNVMAPPFAIGTDSLGDLGLGRQTRLLELLLSGEYVGGLFGINEAAPSLEGTLTKLRDDPGPAVRVPGEQTGVPRLEGYEQALLQSLAFYQSRAHVRMHGRDLGPKSYLFDLSQRELRNAAKAAIRAAGGRLAADVEGNKLLFIARADYHAAGCLTGTENPASPRSIDTLFPKACQTFEEHVVSTAVKSIRRGLAIFTRQQVEQIYGFYRVAADPTCAAPNCRTQIVDELPMNTFTALLIQFIEGATNATVNVFLDTIINDQPSRRGNNATRAIDEANTARSAATRVLEDRVFNDTDLAFTNIALTLDSDFAPSTSHLLSTIKERSEPVVDVVRDTSGRAIRDQAGALQPIFRLRMPATGIHPVTIFLDPTNKVRECNPRDNYSGFFTYPLDPNNPSLQPFEDRPPSPVPLPTPPPECAEHPTPELTVTKLVNGQSQIRVAPGTRVKLSHLVTNTGQTPLEGVMIADRLTSFTYGPFTVPVGASSTLEREYEVTATGQELVGPTEVIGFGGGGRIATAWDSVIIDVVAPSCTVAIARLSPDPNPYAPAPESAGAQPPPARPFDTGDPWSPVERRGRLFRYYKVVDGYSGAPLAGASVQFRVNGQSRIAHTDAKGFIVHQTTTQDENPVGLEVRSEMLGNQPGYYKVEFESVNGQSGVCSETFWIELLPRKLSHQLEVGNAVKLEGEFEKLLTLSGAGGTGFTLGIDGTTDSNDKASFGRSLEYRVGIEAELGKIQFGVNFPGTAGLTNVAAGVTAGLDVFLGLRDSHEVTLPLEPPGALAMGGLFLSTLLYSSSLVIGPIGPILAMPVNEIFERITTLDAFRKNVGASIGLAGNFSATTGLPGLNVTNSLDVQDFHMRMEAVAEAAVTGSFDMMDDEMAFGIEYRAGLDLPGFLVLHQAEAALLDPLSLDLVREALNNLKGLLDLNGTGSIKFTTTLERSGLRRMTRLDVDIDTKKLWGFTRQHQLADGHTNAVGTSHSYRFSVTNPFMIAEAVEQATIVQMLAPFAANPVTGPLLGAELFGEELAKLMRLFDEFTYTDKRGNGILLPFSFKKIIAGQEIGGELDLRADNSVSFTKQKGVYRPVPGGTSARYVLERYDNDQDVPDPSLAAAPLALLDEILDFVKREVLSAYTSFVKPILPTAVELFTLLTHHFSPSGIDLRVDHHAEPAAFDLSLVAFKYKPVLGPVATTLQSPADIKGRADQPHYGVGGFFQLAPEGKVLAAPAELTITYEDANVAGLDESTFAIYAWNPTRSDWDYVGGVVDPANNTVRANITTLRTYTVAPAMPAGNITFTVQSTSPGSDSTSVTYASSALRLNTGQPIPDGTLFTVQPIVPEASALTPFGEVTTSDEEPSIDGVQVRSSQGRLTFSATYPGAFGRVRVLAYPVHGTAISTQVIPFP